MLVEQRQNHCASVLKQSKGFKNYHHANYGTYLVRCFVDAKHKQQLGED